MENIINKITEKKGSMLIISLGIMLVISFILMLGFEFMRIYTTAKSIQKNLGNSIVITNTRNMDNSYYSIREGFSGAYIKSGDEWIEEMEPDEIFTELASLLSLVREGGGYVRYSNDKLEYRLSDLRVEQENGDFAPVSPDGSKQVQASASVQVEIPISAFGGYLDMVPPLRFRIHVQSRFVPKF